MYADFESILEPIHHPNPEPMGPYTSLRLRLPSTRHVVGAFTANLHMERLKTH